jgi:hypothetical protein
MNSGARRQIRHVSKKYIKMLMRVILRHPQLLHLHTTDLPAALHELSAVQSGALLKTRGKISVDEPVQSVFEETIVSPADFLVERVGDSGKGIDQAVSKVKGSL